MSDDRELELDAEAGPDPRVLTAALSTALIGVVGLTMVLTPAGAPNTRLHEWWLALGVIAGFVIAERMIFHLESRSEAVSHTPTDIPLAFAVVLLSPPVAICARLLGAGLGLAVWRRPPLFKLCLNLASFAMETMIVVFVFRALTGGTWPVEPSLTVWMALIVSMSLGLVVNGVMIAIAISFFEGDAIQRVRTELRHSYLFYVPGAVLGASAALPALVAVWLMVPFLVPAPLVWLVLRSHGSLMHRYSDLTEIHEFSSHIGRSAHLDDIVATAVDEVARHMRAEKVALVMWSRDESPPIQVSNGAPDLLDLLPIDGGDAAWQVVLAAEVPVAVAESDNASPVSADLRVLGLDDTVIVPMIDDDGCVGLLAVAGRQGVADTFDEDDHRRLLALSQQLVVALRKGQLHVQIQHQATHDRLTGLPNRAYFEAATGQILGAHGTDPSCLLLIDLDRFKEVNDTFGHHAGDQLLIETTRRISSQLSRGAMAFRFGGDEFAIVAPGFSIDEAIELATSISEALEESYELGDAVVALASSIGIAEAPTHGRRVDDLVRRADLAMYDAKTHHERYEVFDDRLEVTDSARLEMLGDLRECLLQGGLEVHFQPKLDVRTNEVRAVEALARWTHPERGPVPPGVFIPLAEQSGLIGALTEQVLATSLASVKHWQKLGRRIGVAVNVSAQTLVRDDLPELIAENLKSAGVAPDLLTVEVTESTMMGDDERTFATLDRLDELGIRVSVDDFGTGYSSLVNLKHLPVSELKIDRSFVMGLGNGPSDDVIVRSTIEMAHNLGLSVVAEGVETDEQLDRLAGFGCDLAQGFGICRPVPRKELDEWMRARSSEHLAS